LIRPDLPEPVEELRNVEAKDRTSGTEPAQIRPSGERLFNSDRRLFWPYDGVRTTNESRSKRRVRLLAPVGRPFRRVSPRPLVARE
jgi:hypothetical protein